MLQNLSIYSSSITGGGGACNEPRLQTETCSVAFGIFRECGTALK